MLDKILPKQPTGERWIVVFPSMQQTLQAHQLMESSGVQGDFIPTPKGFGPVCTTAIVFSGFHGPEVQELLSNHRLTPQALEPWRSVPPGEAWQKALEQVETAAYGDLLNQARELKAPSLEEVVQLLSPPTPADHRALQGAADALRQETLGDVVDIRGAVEFGNRCRKNCHYCGLRKENHRLSRYRMDNEAILAAVGDVYALGIRTVILQSGEELPEATESLVELIKSIKKQFGLRITLSLGERSFEDYRAFRRAGANNYLLRIETTDPEVFERVHPDDDLQERKQHLLWLREAGFLLGTGGIVGLPGQKVASIAQDILYWRDLGANMIGVGPFLPAEHTPLENHPPGDLDLTLRAVAVTRLLCGRAFIPATTSLATLHPDGQRYALEWGANSIMLINTPETYRANYHLYQKKAKVDLDFACRSIKEAGRQLPNYIQGVTC
ncbi:[FeFe] hydrogenase H-cluster radical SAM maturase HydE [Heliobacterium chlorum]|uniref:[FeFe] hydrogenase H-cluster radical SAM maturase HydE n=1 Tax=Heliobacterium chlorum TaxID=2698 RepID=A0ABR7T4Z2_HELCL|nr:[FeFe] hydrogenase H-cluster radical SAM maturase HydE [Heliobacterium chlorum]MBC9785005.1 [FeFe] hydrogenase H-cluster radical SAM maturase HydE [Heliobacterium chlorum]